MTAVLPQILNEVLNDRWVQSVSMHIVWAGTPETLVPNNAQTFTPYEMFGDKQRCYNTNRFGMEVCATAFR